MRRLTSLLGALLIFTWLIQPMAAAAQAGNAPAATPGNASDSETDRDVDPIDQTSDADRAAAAAVDLSRLETSRAFATLYDRMHPDARAAIPEAAVVGWYETDFAGKRTSPATVTGVTFVDWTWEVTGQRYPRTAAVSFTQPYWVDGVRQDVAATVHLVEADGKWGWFFGGTRAFVDEQIALYDPDAEVGRADAADAGSIADVPEDPLVAIDRAERFPDPLHAHVDAYWAKEFALADRRYRPPGGVIGFDEPIVTPCGPADPPTEAAFYCVIDETIYYSTEFRSLVEAGLGDFAWIVVVAHEWAHHIQIQLGYELGVSSDQAGDLAPIQLEQQADCLAGAYTQDAGATGWLDDGDVDEALRMTGISGDPPGTSWSDPLAHGSGEQRVDAFRDGYEGGVAACELDFDGA